MGEPGPDERSERDDATRDRLEQELARVRGQRQQLAAQLAGEDPDDAAVGDSGDEATRLEGFDDLARLDGRIGEIERLVAGSGVPDTAPGLADGTVVTLRFPGGDVVAYRVVAIIEEASADDQDVVTVGSPLGQALVGRSAGDTITYRGPDGDLQAEVVAVADSS